MIYLGKFKAGNTVFYAANFHNDTGTIENPTSPEAQIRNSAGTWSALTAPAIQNSKIGHYGGTIDTTGYSVGQHVIRMAGIVTTAKTIATEFCFAIVANIESDIYDKVDTEIADIQSRLPSALTANGNMKSSLVEILTTALTETVGQIAAAFKQFFDTASPTGTMKSITNVGTTTNLTTNNDKTGYSISGTKTTLDALNDITAASVWVVTTRTLTSFGTLIDDIWNYSTRTITAFSTSLALSVWDVLETAILTASSIGLKVKNNLDALISSRLATSGYTAPDNAGISYILAESQSHPTLGEIEASAVIAKEATSSAIKTKTDTIIWGDVTSIKDVSIGKWSINKTTNVLTIYKVDGVTVLKTFNLTDNSSVSERVPI